MSRWCYRLLIVKRGSLFLLAAMLLSGCASSSIESRQRERATAFASLPADQQTLVRDGQIRRGMSADAVYIAWGKPAQILQREDARGLVTVWLYHGGWMEDTRYWPYGSRVPAHDYQPRTYVSAEITFVNGVVEAWRTLAQPTY
jgi:hypothetical protein